jgi:hypothetical protein
MGCGLLTSVTCKAKGNNSSDWYETVLRQVAVDRRAEYVSTKLDSSVRKGVDGTHSHTANPVLG